MKVIVDDFEVDLEVKKSGVDKFEVNIGKDTYNVEILNFTKNHVVFSVNNKIFTFNFAFNEDSTVLADSNFDYNCKVISKYQSVLNAHREASFGESRKEKILRSPMPGLITKIFVNPGAKIKVGDRLLILEAMKMENEIRSEVDGVVEEVLINEGTAVEKGTPILKISTN